MKSKKPSKAEVKNEINPLPEENLPATRGMLRAVRDELRSEIVSVGLRVESRDLNFESLGKKIDSVASELKGELSSMKASIDRMSVLLEEQNSNNKYVLEALVGQTQRQDRIEKRMDGVEDLVRAIARFAPGPTKP